MVQRVCLIRSSISDAGPMLCELHFGLLQPLFKNADRVANSASVKRSAELRRCDYSIIGQKAVKKISSMFW